MAIVALLGLVIGGPAALAAPSMEMPPAPGVYVNAEGSPLLPLLKNARGSLDIEIYTMNDTTVRALLRDALARGVRVRIVKDPNPLGEKCNVFGGGGAASADCADQQRLVGEVRAAGGVFEPFDKQALCPNGGGTGGDGCFEHGKIALADGLALLSTGNFDDTNLCLPGDGAKTCNRDYTLIENDPTIVSTLENIFEADLRGASYDVRSLIPGSLSDRLTVSPVSLPPLLAFINGARQSIDLEAQYLKDPDLNQALVAAARRGVRVSVTVASPCAFGRPKAAEAKEIQSVYSPFDQAGISSRMFNASNLINGLPGYMHAKVIVVDGERAWLGSENGSAESLTQNREYGLIFDDAQGVQTILETATADHESPDSESWQESLSCAKDGKGGGGALEPPSTPVRRGHQPRVPSGTRVPRKPRRPRKPQPGNGN